MGVNAYRIALLAVFIRFAHLGLLVLLDQLFADYDTSSTLLASVGAPIVNHLSSRIHNNSFYQSADRSIDGFTWRSDDAAAWRRDLATTAARSIRQLLDGLIVWDSVFFAEIAKHGYSYEQFYAFFPLMPALSGLLGPSCNTLLMHLVGLISSVAMAVLFARLSEEVLQDPVMAARATMFLLLGQACTFHTAAYTESLFGVATMAGLHFLYYAPGSISHAQPSSRNLEVTTSKGIGNHRKRASFVGACLAFMLASMARSNGIINGGYLLHHSLEGSIEEWQQGKLAAGAASLAAGVVAAAATAVPLVAFQMHGYSTFCCANGTTHTSTPCSSDHSGFSLLAEVMQPFQYWMLGRGVCAQVSSDEVAVLLKNVADGSSRETVCTSAGSLEDVLHSCMAQDSCARVIANAIQHGSSSSNTTCSSNSSSGGAWSRPWCHGQLPRIYSFVQEHYWGVGLLKYWQVQQLPNFLLASPVLLLAAAGVWTYAAANKRHFLLGGFMTLLTAPRQQRLPDIHTSGFLVPAVAVHVYPWAFMSACALLLMHVQVATRFLSCCPAMYWFMAHLATYGEGSSVAVVPDKVTAGLTDI